MIQIKFGPFFSKEVFLTNSKNNVEIISFGHFQNWNSKKGANFGFFASIVVPLNQFLLFKLYIRRVAWKIKTLKKLLVPLNWNLYNIFKFSPGKNSPKKGGGDNRKDDFLPITVRVSFLGTKISKKEPTCTPDKHRNKKIELSFTRSTKSEVFRYFEKIFIVKN